VGFAVLPWPLSGKSWRDITRNTTSLLPMLRRRGVFKYHVVGVRIIAARAGSNARKSAIRSRRIPYS
jgi:hypothetical protein